MDCEVGLQLPAHLRGCSFEQLYSVALAYGDACVAGYEDDDPPCDNPWDFNFDFGDLIYEAPDDFCVYFNCIDNFDYGNGYVIQCRDHMFSHSGGRQGSCSYHGGNYRALFDPN